MGDIIKRNWPLVAVIGVTLVISIVLFVLVLSSNTGVAKATEDLNKVIDGKNRINQFEYQLTESNRVRAKNVAKQAWEQYDKAYNSIHELTNTSAPLNKRVGKYLIAEKKTMTPVRAKTALTRSCEAMKKTLDQQGIICSAVGQFTFDDVVGTSKLPDLAAIPALMRNADIIEEIVRLVSESGVKVLSGLTRPELDLADQGGDYMFLPFTMSVEGTYPTVRKLVNDLNEADYLFITRKLSVTGTDTIAAFGAPPKPKSKKHERIVFKDLSAVKATIEFDYVELTRAKP